MVIYDKAGSILLDIEVDDTSVRYKAIKGENSLTLKFSLAEHVEVPLGSYCVFKGETYSLMMPEDLTMNHRRSFEYTLVMYSGDARAKRYVFVNPVDGRVKFSLTAKPIEHLQMFVDNMNMRDAGWSVGECPDHVEITLSYNSTKCHDALVQQADELKLDYWFNGKVVNIGKLELNKDNPLSLSYGGDGEGLKSNVKRTNYSDALPIEVLFVQGTETNIDASKYGASELHLPKGQTIRFDGTYFEDEEGFDESKARSYKTDEKGYSVTRADKEISNHSEDSLDCSDIEPTKEEVVSAVIEVSKDKHFYDILFASNVDYSQYVIGGESATIVFQSGMLAGKEFDLATDSNGNLICKKEENLWRVEIVPQDIDGITMPDAESGYVPIADDTFKVFGIQLPDEYISDNDTKSGAEWDMFRFAVKHFYTNEDVQYTISGELDEIYAKRNWERIKDRLTLGNYISFSDRSFQEEPLLIRITGIKDYVNKPYSPQLEISNAALSGTLVGALNRIENQEVETEDKIKQAIGFSKRKWRDAKETLSMLSGAVANFTEGISPITVETMSMLIGDERLQFIFTESLASDVVVDLMYSYDLSTGTFSVQSGFIKHMTLGIDSISPVHADEEYKRWSVSEVSEALDRESGYYLYAKVSKDSTAGTFELHKTIQTDTDEAYFLLVGILNSEYDGGRSFASMYGFTEVRPGQITTDIIRSSDGSTWLDLLKGILHLNNMAGVTGVKTAEKGDQSIAAWFGGQMKDIELDEDKENAAKSVIRHDGTGYFANSLFSWDKNKGINLGDGSIKINYDGSVEFGGNIKIGGTGEETLDSLLTIVATLAEYWYQNDAKELTTDLPVRVKNDFTVEGDISTGGVGQTDNVSVSGILVNGVRYIDTDYDGYIDLSDAFEGLQFDIDLSEYYTKAEVDTKIASIDLSDYYTKADVDKKIEEIDLSPYATKTDLQAMQDEVDALENLLGSDVSGYIDTWEEVVSFLDGYKDSEDLAAILSTMEGKIGDNTNAIATLGGSVTTNTADIASLGGMVSKNTADIAKNAEDIASLDSKMSPVKAWHDNLSPYIVYEDGVVKIKASVVAEGDISSGGQGSGEVVTTTTLAELEDVSVESITNGDILIYNRSTGKWENKPQTAIVPDLTGYATEAWVYSQGYLKPVDLEDYAKTSEVLEEVNKVSEALDEMWKVDEEDNLTTEKKVVVSNDMYVEGDISSAGIGTQDTKNKGYFRTAEDLTLNYPIAYAGCIAYVGLTYPYAIYVWDVDTETWVDSGQTGGQENVPLGDYYTKAETHDAIKSEYVVLTQEEYDALAVKEDKLYFIYEEE